MTDRKKVKRTDSNTSLTSIGFASIGQSQTSPQRDDSRSSESETSLKLHEETEAIDLCQVVVFCVAHQKICTTRIKGRSLWLPSIPFDSRESFASKCNELLDRIGISADYYQLSSLAMINVFRVQPTVDSPFITRYTFLVRILKGPSNDICCFDTDKIKWVLGTKVTKVTSFWGPEIVDWTRFWINHDDINDSAVKRQIEYDTSDALIDFCQTPALCVRKEQVILKSAVFTEKDILRLWESFCHHCYPSQFMSLRSFKIFLKHIDIRLPERNLTKIFQAFDVRRRTYITFNELLLGFAAMDAATEHGGQSGALRCEYIFRFYNSNRDSFLSLSDICQMIEDIKKKRTNHSFSGSTESHAQRLIQEYGSNNRLSCDQFTQAVSDLKFRGTSELFRALGPTLTKHSSDRRTSFRPTDLSALTRQNNYEIPCEVCRRTKFKISTNRYIMNKNGEIVDFKRISREFNIHESQLRDDFPDKDTFVLAQDVMNRIIRLYQKRWPQTRNIRGVLDQEAEEKMKNWWYSSRAELCKKLVILCQKAKEIFEREDRVLTVGTPCYMFGDIHGNLKDLMTFSIAFWRASPFVNESNYLFLGDYVDRGLYGVECVAYLLAMKLLAPKRFWLVRGNHEIRSLQEMFTFFTECTNNYSEKVWTSFNDVFDRLPIAAIVDNKIFGCHGGIPRSYSTIEQLMTLPRVLSDPQVTNPAAWEVLWNDPMPDDEFRALTKFEREDAQSASGFLTNLKRGTAFYYTEIAVQRFLQLNGLQFIVRGHECVQNGYKFMINGRVTTIFSTSLYCGLRNTAAVMFVNNAKLRVIQVKTFD